MRKLKPHERLWLRSGINAVPKRPRGWGFFVCLFVFVFCLFGVTPKACGDSQDRGQIGAIATGLCHRHSDARSKPHL